LGIINRGNNNRGTLVEHWIQPTTTSKESKLALETLSKYNISKAMKVWKIYLPLGFLECLDNI